MMRPVRPATRVCKIDCQAAGPVTPPPAGDEANVTDGVLLAVVSAAVVLTAAGVFVTLATDDRDPSIVLAWLFVIVLAPVLGLAAYFLVGRNLRAPGRWTTRQRKSAAVLYRALTRIQTFVHPLGYQYDPAASDPHRPAPTARRRNPLGNLLGRPDIHRDARYRSRR